MVFEGMQKSLQGRAQRPEPLRKLMEEILAEKEVLKKAIEAPEEEESVVYLHKMPLKGAKCMLEYLGIILQTVEEVLRKK